MAKTLDQMFEAFQRGEVKELPLVVKGDVQGSLEPIVSSLKDLSAGEIKVNILHAATGNITVPDVTLAAASGGIVIGFRVQGDPGARRVAEAEGLDIRLYDIIYRLTEDIEKALKGMLAPETRQVVIGKAEVRAVFRIPKIGNIAGCHVSQGEVRRNAKARLLRGKDVIFDGAVSSLRHEKEDIREIREGFECGIGLKGFTDFQVGDVIECYTSEQVPAE